MATKVDPQLYVVSTKLFFHDVAYQSGHVRTRQKNTFCATSRSFTQPHEHVGLVIDLFGDGAKINHLRFQTVHPRDHIRDSLVGESGRAVGLLYFGFQKDRFALARIHGGVGFQFELLQISEGDLCFICFQIC